MTKKTTPKPELKREIKPYQELTIADDYMFSKVMSQPKFCQPFLEALLEVKIAKIDVIDKQKDLKDTYDAHGIRLDVYVKDKKGTIYDVEMQTTTQEALEKRIRYYQSGIDRYALATSRKYKNLSDSYIIFICLDDYFNQQLARYDRISYIVDAKDPTKTPICDYCDGSHVIILNASFLTGNTDDVVLDFLRYAWHTYNKQSFMAASEYVREIDEAVEITKHSEKEEAAYMTFAAKLQEAMEEGIDIGQYRLVRDTVFFILDNGDSLDESLKHVRFPEELVERAVAEWEAQNT